MKHFLYIIIFFFFTSSCLGQTDTLKVNRLKTVVIGEAVAYSGAMVGLYSLWYKDQSSSSFHLFNDNEEWLQVDKIGHSMTSYYVGIMGYEALKWSGVSNEKSIWIGGSLGNIFLTSVEVFDGYSKGWGFSWGDVIANTAGSALFIGQQLAWNEQRVLLKYSFHQTQYAAQRPNLLGDNLIQNSLKDYNGQTYWMSVNIASFLSESTGFPNWLNFAIGYGADGMLGGFNNDKFVDVNRIRQYYISMDVDLTRIKTKSKFANTVLGAFGFIKFPFPALEFNQNGKTQLKGVHF